MKSFIALTDHDAPLSEVISTLQASQSDHQAQRRTLLRALAGAGVMSTPLAGYAACAVIPSETGGPFPGDGTNGANALTQSGIVRSDMRSNFGVYGAAIATGINLTVKLQLVNVDNNCALLPGYGLYLWHCDATGNYSLYGTAANNNFLRGVQAAAASGNVTFTTTFPGAYSGRWPHMHFEIFRSLSAASTGQNAIKTSQLALPDATCREVYTANTAIYPSSLSNLNATPLTRDNVFSNGTTLQTATITGSAAQGYVATLTIGIAAGAGIGIAPSTATNTNAVEFYNTTLGHYVVIGDAGEIATIDAGGAGPGWQRTGVTYAVPTAATTATTDSIPVYRFYGSQSPGPNSHFYTIGESEKAQLIALAAATPATQKRWNFEGVGFRAGAASSTGCTQTTYTVPVYRLYNNGFPTKDSNHRYAVSTTVVNEMIAKGWTLEGVAFCSATQ